MKRSKFFILVSLVVILVALPFMAACAKPAPSPAEPIVWKLNAWFSPVHLMMAPLESACDKVYERSNGRLNIEIYPGFALGFKPSTWLRDHKEGLIDISTLDILFTCGEEPSFCVLEADCLFDTTEQKIKAMKALADFKKTMYDEVWGSEYIATGMSGTWSMCISSKGKQVRTLDDLKGMKIRAAGARGKELFEFLGAAPQVMGRGEVYMAMKTGVIDGFHSGYGSLYKDKYHEVIDYATLMGHAPLLENDIVVSRRVWDPLPADLKKIVRDVFAEWAANQNKMALDGIKDAEDKKLLEEAGIICTELSKEERVRLRDIALKIQADWVEREGGRVAEAWEIVKPFLPK